MLRVADLAEVTDAVTLSRGRAYARQGRVESLHRTPGELHAEVLGSDTYHVRIGDGSWRCDCPVGVTGAFCKHCVAVVVAAETDSDLDPVDVASSASSDPVVAWLEGLDARALRELLRDATAEVPGVAELVARAFIASTDDVAALRTQVEGVLRPRRTFYEYHQANRYADEAEPLLQLLTEMASRPSPGLLDVIERALALAVRTILRSDDSAGAQGDQVHRLLDLHAAVAGAGTPDAAARRRLAGWLHRFVFSGKQDFFAIDVDRYAYALGPDGVAEYRRLVDRSAEKSGEDAFDVRYARGRLAVLDRDPEAIVAVIGGELRTQHDALRVVEALDDAGLTEHAVEQAARGLRLAQSPHAGALVQRLVDDAMTRDDGDRVLMLRREAFARDASATTFAAFRTAALELGAWEAERAAAEAQLSRRRPWEWVAELLRSGRDDEAWDFAVAHPDAGQGQWERLCARRAETAPADTVPHYQRMVTESLATTGRGSYLTAARLLVRLRAACASAGIPTQYVEFMAATAEANRRRPTCIDELVHADLIRRDRSVIEL